MQMPYELPLPPKLKSERWKVKIWDKEIGEDPHVTIVRKTVFWRWAIRSKSFMDATPDPSEIPKEILVLLSENYRLLCLGWNEVHPDDPVDVPVEPDEQEEMENENE